MDGKTIALRNEASQKAVFEDQEIFVKKPILPVTKFYRDMEESMWMQTFSFINHLMYLI